MTSRMTSRTHASAAAKTPAFHSHFDPMELLGSRVPFLDPFTFDDDDFEEARGAQHTAGHSNPTTSSPAAVHLNQFIPGIQLSESYNIPIQRTSSLPPAGPIMYPEQLEARAKLTSDQAIHIYEMRSTKTSSTAALLSAEYGITSKAIRDIWTRKSWAAIIRPYWPVSVK